nr:MAG TPA: hypothetical protein [Caudoviricetes sp.]
MRDVLHPRTAFLPFSVRGCFMYNDFNRISGHYN